MSLDNQWITEACEEGGSAFSLKLKRKLHDEQSEFQRIEIFETENFGNLMLIDGYVMLSQRDNFLYHEMMSHPALFSHPDPKRVVIIGGGDCGTLREVLKHPTVEHALQVEIDECVTRLSEQYFPELCESNHDPRAEFFFGDGIKWMKDAEPGSVDIIIIDSTDPIGPAKGLFTEAFYRDCHKALGEQGFIVQQSESPLYHMRILKPMHQAIRAAGFSDSITFHFPQPVYPSGWWSCTMGCKATGFDQVRNTDIDNRGFETVYYNSDMHLAAMAQPEFCRKAFEKL